jgi:uncharacterized protein (TIGR02996 family)
MTHHAGFLQDIIEHPADDAPRLIYADWLDEHGEPDRAAFIRVQCALAAPPWRAGRVYDDPAWLRLYAREQELLEPGGLRHLPGPFWRTRDAYGWSCRENPAPRFDVECRFRRGFVAEVTLPLSAWMEHGPAMVRAAPLERVWLADRKPLRYDGSFFWLRHPGVTFADDLPYLLPDDLAYVMSAAERREGWESEAAAREALSIACLKWARKPVAAAH